MGISVLLQNLAILTIDQVEKKEADIQKAVNYNYTDKDIELVSFFPFNNRMPYLVLLFPFYAFRF